MSVKYVLEGRPFGHPVHPFLTHLPLGLWLLGLILDIGAVAIEGWQWATVGAFAAIALGTGVGVLVVITGFVDWIDIRGDRMGQKVALWHMGMVLPAMGLFAVDTLLHWGYVRHGALPTAGLGVSIVGYLLALVGGYLGGRLVYDDGMAVGRHRRAAELPPQTLEPEAGAKEVLSPTLGLGREYHPVVPEAALNEEETLRVRVDGKAIALVRAEGVIYAIQEFCTHRCGPLSEGSVHGREIECPWHRSVFDLATGKPTHGPAEVDLKTYEVRVQNGIIHVNIGKPGRVPAEREGAERRNPPEGRMTPDKEQMTKEIRKPKSENRK